MKEPPDFLDNLAKLSPEDRERYNRDVLWYGRAFIKKRADGSVVYVAHEDWPDVLKKAK